MNVGIGIAGFDVERRIPGGSPAEDSGPTLVAMIGRERMGSADRRIRTSVRLMGFVDVLGHAQFALSAGVAGGLLGGR